MDWLAREEEFASMIAGTSSDAEFYEALERILILLQNGHTNIIEPGVVYEDYARIYSGSTPWSQIYNDNRVRGLMTTGIRSLPNPIRYAFLFPSST